MPNIYVSEVMGQAFGGIAVADEYRPIHGAGRQRFGLHGLWASYRLNSSERSC